MKIYSHIHQEKNRNYPQIATIHLIILNIIVDIQNEMEEIIRYYNIMYI